MSDVDIVWEGRHVTAWVPTTLESLELTLPENVVRLTERAAAAIERTSHELPTSWEPLARLLLRLEGIASSAFEQVRAPLEEIVAAEVTDLMTGPSAWVSDNLAVVATAIDSARREPLSVDALLKWHRQLMVHATHRLEPTLIGAFRDRPVWVGGNSPFTAAYVAPPPEFVRPLLEDLVAFANSDSLDAVTQAALLHAQFESIHPFADGNGRLGRVLMSWLLVRRLDVAVPPPLSVVIAHDPGGYLSGLTFFRLGEHAKWVQWFATALERSANAATSLVTETDALLARWRERATKAPAPGQRAVRAGSVFWKVLDALPALPILSAPLVAERFGVTPEDARQLLRRFESLHILEPIDLATKKPGRPTHWWAATELLALVSRWS